MVKIVTSLLGLILLLVTIDSHAGDNLILNKYFRSSEIPEKFYLLGGGEAMVSKTYLDSGKVRSDKVYYTMTHAYNSNYHIQDIAKILNPSAGRMESLFENTQIKSSPKSGIFDVLMEITTPIKNFLCASSLNLKNTQEGKKQVFLFTFTNFNMVFTDMVVRVEVDETTTGSRLQISQISALKGLTHDKLKSFFAVGKFEKALKLNLMKFKEGVGGV